MKFCTDHWSKLRQAIADRGLETLIAKNGHEAAARMVSEDPKRGFEPLMWAHNAIVSKALDRLGLALIGPAEDGSEQCPLCAMQAAHDEACREETCTFTFEATWIPGAADDARSIAVDLGVMPSDTAGGAS